jgi:hypothetical protein
LHVYFSRLYAFNSYLFERRPPLFLEAVSCYVAQAGLELGNTPVSATSVFGITNMHHHCLLLNTYCLFAMTNKLQFYHYLAIISLA